MQIPQKGSLLQDWVLTTQTGYTTMSHHYKTMAMKGYLFCQQETFAYLWQVSMNLLQASTKILSNSLQIPIGSGVGAPTIKDPDLTIKDVYFHLSTKVKLRHCEKATKLKKISHKSVDKTAAFTQQRQNKRVIFSNFCGLLRKAEFPKDNEDRGHSLTVKVCQ